MSPESPDLAASCSAAEVAAELNARIRALWTGPGGHPTLRLTDAQRAEYERLCEQLRQVQRGDITTAA